MIRRATAVVSLAMSVMILTPTHVFPQEGTREPVSHQHVISGNPLILLAGWFNAEYETKLAEAATIGAAGGWLDLDDADYTSLNAFLRFYPQGAAFTGFYLGGRAGIHNVEEDNDSDTVFGIGIDIGYTWLLGPGRSFYVGLGIGPLASSAATSDPRQRFPASV